MSLDSSSVAHLVQRLSAPERSARLLAARELYRRGCDLAEQAILPWRNDSEIAPLVSRRATVGIAVMPAHFSAIRSALGNPRLASVPPGQDAEEFEWTPEENLHLDILTTSDPEGNGAIAKFLAKFGEGIQQVEFLTRDVSRATEAIRSRTGIEPIYSAARAGADGTRVNFFLAATPDGRKVLLELVES